jgi:hypothetical protein
VLVAVLVRVRVLEDQDEDDVCAGLPVSTGLEAAFWATMAEMDLCKRASLRAAVMCAGLAGCGGQTAAPAPAAQSSGQEAPEAAAQDGMSVTGLRGTLSQNEIQGALEPRMLKFAQCVQRRSEQLDVIAGGMALEFHVALDGKVDSVYPRESNLGDREAERCVLALALATRFPAPRGGEAEFSWSFEVPPDDSVREPVALSAEDVAGVIEQNRALIDATCGTGSYLVTAYIDPSGKAVAVGAAARDAPSALNLDCVTEAIENFTFASPGSYVAKVTFPLP